MKKLIEAAEIAVKTFKEVAEYAFLIAALGVWIYCIFSPIFK